MSRLTITMLLVACLSGGILGFLIFNFHPAKIFMGAFLVNNIILLRFIGLCPFFGVSTSLNTSVGMSAAVLFVMLLASWVSWVLYHALLLPFMTTRNEAELALLLRLHEGLARYEAVYVDTFREHASAKLGLAACTDEDLEHLHALYGLMHAAEMDMTITFRALADVDVDAPSIAPFADAFYDEGKRTANELALDAWLARRKRDPA